MGQEIERKFLVDSKLWTTEKCIKRQVIQQGYLSKSQKHTVRIRVTDTSAYVTIKGPTKGITRAEYEYAIPVEDGRELLAMCDAPIINKVRYVLKDRHGQVWDVDEFRGINNGLIVAEIELKSEHDNVELPPWVGKEVSHDKRYTNTYLSTHKVSIDD